MLGRLVVSHQKGRSFWTSKGLSQQLFHQIINTKTELNSRSIRKYAKKKTKKPKQSYVIINLHFATDCETN